MMEKLKDDDLAMVTGGTGLNDDEETADDAPPWWRNYGLEDSTHHDPGESETSLSLYEKSESAW